MFKTALILLIFFGFVNTSSAQSLFEKDHFKTSKGELEITFIGHGTLMLGFQGKVIHIDPWKNLTDYLQLPKADIILITHEHSDHLSIETIDIIKKEDTIIVLNEASFEQISQGVAMKNGNTQNIKGIEIGAVPAYNIVHKYDNGQPFHPKGRGNGYVIKFAELTVYIAGDTENIPEMADLKNVDIAFLPMNLPYTMTPEMVADAARLISPKILYPYHFGNTDTGKLIELLKDRKDIEIRIRKMA